MPRKKKLPLRDYILDYYQAITDGSITVGNWIRRVYERVIEGLAAKEFFFDIKKANSAIDFIETHCHHSEGDLAPGLLKLELWQKAMISCIFGLVDEKGNRQFREIVTIVSRKNGKSLLASSIIAKLIYDDGEYGAKVFCVAPKLDQAAIVYNAFWQTVQLEPGLADITKHRKSDIYVEGSNSSVKTIAFNAKKSDGLNPLGVVCDEIAAWPGEQGLRQYEVLKSALGARRQPMIFSISTAGYISDSIYDELIKRSTKWLQGDSKERRLLPFLYMIDDVEKWNDINELRKSNPNLGVSVSVDYMLEEIAVAEGSLSKKGEFLTKYCNIKQNASTAWLPATAVEACCGDPVRLEDFRGCYCVAGVDLSQAVDLTALVAVIERGGKLNVWARFYMPAARLEEATARDGVPYRLYEARGILKLSGENHVEYTDVYNDLVEMVNRYELYPLKVGYDRYSAHELVQALDAFGFHTDDVIQADNLWPIIQQAYGLILDGQINIGDNDLLKIHLLNTAVKMNNERGRGRIIKIAATEHIDGTAALLDALTMRDKYAGEVGDQLRNAR